MYPLPEENASRVLIAMLGLTRNRQTVSLGQVASKAHASKAFVRSVLRTTLGELDEGPLYLSPILRFELAMNAAKTGGLKEVVRNLTWQEFETFTEECLFRAGFTSERNVRVEGGGRKWEIDVVGFRGPLVLGFDCKHWKPPNHLSRFSRAAARQRQAVTYLATISTDVSNQRARPVALSLILTLHDPPQTFHEGSVLLSIEKLPDFLDKITPLSAELPFILPENVDVENPIKEATP